MNNASGGDILFHFKGDTKDIDSKTTKVESKFKGLGSTIGKAVLAGTAVATGAITKFVKDSVSSFAEFEQLEGGLKAMFEGNAEQITRVMNKSKKAYEELQMSQNQYLQSFESSYAIIKNGISDEADAIEYTNKTLQLTADLFNTCGGSTEQYANAINWALKGTFSYVDNLNLGIKGTQEGFVEAANNCGVLGREIQNVNELTSDEIIDVIQAYAEKTGAWGRSTTEASTTIMGSLNMVKASWSDLLNEMGKENGNVEGVFNNFMKSVETFGSQLLPLLERILNSIVQYLPGVVDKLANALPSLVENLLPNLITSAVNVIKSLISAIPGILKSLANMLPSIVQTLITGLIDVVNALAEEMDTLIPILVDAILDIIPIIIDNLPLFYEAGYKLLWGILKGLWNALPSLLSNIPNIIKLLVAPFFAIPSKMIGIGADLLKGLWNGIKNATGWVVDKIKGMGKTILNAVKGIFGVHSPSTEFEFIGKMNMVGLEKGMEGLQPEIQKTIDSLFDLSPSLTGTMNNTLSPNIIVNNNVSMETDPLGQVVSNIKTFSGGAKNDYNYGMGV